MKKAAILSVTGFFACILLMSQIKVMSNGDLKIGTGNTAVYFDQTGRFFQSSGWDFNPNTTRQGLVFEYGDSEAGGFYVDGDYAVIWSPGDYNRLLRIYDEDNMSSGSTTFEKAYIDGAGNYYTASDRNRKEDIVEVDNAMGRLKKIKGVKYKYRKDEANERAKMGSGEDISYLTTSGLIAQEVEEVIPEAVQTDEFGNKFLNYDGLIPYLIEAVKEQQVHIESLQAELEQLKRTK